MQNRILRIKHLCKDEAARLKKRAASANEKGVREEILYLSGILLLYPICRTCSAGTAAGTAGAGPAACAAAAAGGLSGLFIPDHAAYHKEYSGEYNGDDNYVRDMRCKPDKHFSSPPLERVKER